MYVFSVAFWRVMEIKHPQGFSEDPVKCMPVGVVPLWSWKSKGDSKNTWIWVNKSQFESICQQNINHHCLSGKEQVDKTTGWMQNRVTWNIILNTHRACQKLFFTCIFFAVQSPSTSCLCWPLVVTSHISFDFKPSNKKPLKMLTEKKLLFSQRGYTTFRILPQFNTC